MSFHIRNPLKRASNVPDWLLPPGTMRMSWRIDNPTCACFYAITIVVKDNRAIGTDGFDTVSIKVNGQWVTEIPAPFFGLVPEIIYPGKKTLTVWIPSPKAGYAKNGWNSCGI